MISRRQLLAGIAASRVCAHAASGSILFEGLPIPPRNDVQEVTLARLADGRYWLLFGEGHKLVGKLAKDGGRTWGPTQPLRENGGALIATDRDNVHLRLLHLKSKQLGIVYGGPYSRPGRDGTLHFRTSIDGGASWSRPVVIDPIFDEAGQHVGFAKITRDVTERKKAEQELEVTREALAQSQKLQALGELRCIARG